MEKTYNVTIEKVERGIVSVMADNEEEAKLEASYLYNNHPQEVHWISKKVDNVDVKLFRISDGFKVNTDNKDYEKYDNYKESLNKLLNEESLNKFLKDGKDKEEVVLSAVEHPEHYNQGAIECIEAMEIQFGLEAVMHFCQLCTFKYLWRAGKKGEASEDIEKAKWYADYTDRLRIRMEMQELLDMNDGLCGCLPK